MNVSHMRRIDIKDASPSVCLLVIGYRENPDYWIQCLHSILASEYGSIAGLEIFIDGDEEEDRYMKTLFHDVILEKQAPYPCDLHLCAHGGKRHAMDAGFRHIIDKYTTNDYIIVVDSDTVMEKNAIQKLVECIHDDPRNGCATGNIRIFNRTTYLARIIHARYCYAFTIERGAMSAMGVMNCCSGPFSIYRQKFIDSDFLDDFVGQRYCGKNVGPGDDRHLTLLMLMRGHLSRQTSLAIVETETPDTLHRYFQQQLRWMRSFYREQMWQIRAIPHQNIYLMIITIYELFFPFFILISFIPTFQIVGSIDLKVFYIRVMVTLGILFIRTFLLLCFTGFNPSGLWNLCVFPMYFICLLPIKLYALGSVGIQGWITSTRDQQHSIMNIFRSDIFFIYLFILGWNSLLGYLFYHLFHDHSSMI